MLSTSPEDEVVKSVVPAKYDQEISVLTSVGRHTMKQFRTMIVCGAGLACESQAVIFYPLLRTRHSVLVR
jgi:hypothetical protein